MVKALCEDWVSVNFVDYGYTMKVEKGHFRAITPQLLTLPFQAIRCFLTGSVFENGRKESVSTSKHKVICRKNS